MATEKKYLALEQLQTYTSRVKDLIKTSDDAVLAAAQAYADGLTDNYDSAGSSATAEANAKAYTDQQVGALRDGAVKDNTDAIAKLNGDAETEGSVAKAVKDAQDALQANIDTVDGKADDNAEAIAAINNTETGILKQAKDYTDTEIGKVQEAVDGLGELVGDLPEGTTATTVIGYINQKTEGIASDTAVTELTNRVDAAEDAIEAIEADYLKAADKTELQTNIDTVGEKVTTLVGTDTGKSARAIAVEVLTEALVADNAQEAYDTLEEMSTWLQGHPESAAAMHQAIADIEALIGTIPEDAGVATIVEYLNKLVTAEKTRAEAKEAELQTAVEKAQADATKAQTDLAAEVERAEGAEEGLSARIDALENRVGTGDVTVDSAIATAKQEAIDAAAADATQKANAAETAAKGYADTLNTAMGERVDALEATDHEHANKAELDKIADGDKAKWDAAAEKAHEHANKETLDGITPEKVTAWDAAEQNAKTYADGLNTTMQGKVDALTDTVNGKANQTDLTALATRVTTAEGEIDTLQSEMDTVEALAAANKAAHEANTAAIALKASQADLEAAVTRIAANEEKIAAFKPITEADIDAMFGTDYASIPAQAQEIAEALANI